MPVVKKHGSPPYRIAVLHGGPGAPGKMAPAARELSQSRGVIEPMQGADSVWGQVGELCSALEQNALIPATLIGWSWGAMLGLLTAAKAPWLVGRLIMVASGVFDPNYAKGITQTRLGRLSGPERDEMLGLLKALRDPLGTSRTSDLARLGSLCAKADAYHPIRLSGQTAAVDPHIFQSVWPQVEKMRESGELLDLAGRVECPVTAIHGSYDPHPHQGVEGPLSQAIKDFKFILLDRCGHEPWNERHARRAFFDALEKELT